MQETRLLNLNFCAGRLFCRQFERLMTFWDGKLALRTVPELDLRWKHPSRGHPRDEHARFDVIAGVGDCFLKRNVFFLHVHSLRC